MATQIIPISKKQRRRQEIATPLILFAGISFFIWPLGTYVNMANVPLLLAFILVGILPFFLIILGTIMLAMYLRGSKYAKNLLIIDDEGFIDNAGFGFKGIKIHWEDVSGYRTILKGKRNYLIVELKDDEKYLDQINRPAVRKHLVKMKDHSGGFVGIALGYYETSEEDLMAIFNSKIGGTNDEVEEG